MILVWETPVLVTPVETVSVSALLWLPTPKLVLKPGPVSDGELQSCAVSLATITHQAYLQLLSTLLNAEK